LYEYIEETSFHVKGMLGTIFHVGTLQIHTAGNRANLAAQGIQHPQRVQELIGKIQKKLHDQKTTQALSAQDLVAMLETIRSNVDIPGLIQGKTSKGKEQHRV
jgi:hypothetical protein